MDLEALQDLALRISGERDIDAVLRQIVAGLVQQSGVALARVSQGRLNRIRPSWAAHR